MESGAPRAGWGAWADALAGAALLGLFVVTVGDAASDGSFGYHTFTDRDLSRAWRWREELPVAGAELSRGVGARLPGPALALLMGAPFVASGDAAASGVGLLAQLILGAVGAALLLRRAVGAAPAACAAVVGMSLPPVVVTCVELWNPAFAAAPMVLAAAGLARAALLDRADGWWWWAVGVGVGVQLHLSAAVWFVAAAPVAWVAWGALRRAAPAVGASWAVMAAPYGVVDGARGFANTRALLASLGTNVEGGASRAVPAARLVELLVTPVRRPLDDAPGELAWGAAVLVVAGAAAVGALALVGPDARRRAVAAAALLVVVGAVGSGGAVHVPELPPRYLVALAPAVGLLGALGAARSRAVGAALVVGAAVMGLQWRDAFGAHDPMAWHNLRGALSQAEAISGLSVAELSRRSRWVAATADGVAGVNVPWDHGAAVVGAHFLGSGPGPCWLFVRDGDAGLAARADPVFAALGGLVGEPVVYPLAGPWQLVRVDLAGALCPTSMSQRYVDTPAERALREVAELTPPGGVRPWPTVDGVGWAIRPVVDDAHRLAALVVGVQVRRVGDGVEAEVTSPMLRGPSDNEGWRSQAALGLLEVVAVDDAGVSVSLLAARGLVGMEGVHTPLRATSALDGPGPWTLHLRVLRWGGAPEELVTTALGAWP